MYMPLHYIKDYNAGQKKKMKVYELNATKQKSYYGKALVLENESTIKLQSYETIVAVLNKKTNVLKINGWYSMTTSKHINDFLRELGSCKRFSKKEIYNGLTIQL